MPVTTPDMDIGSTRSKWVLLEDKSPVVGQAPA